MTNADVVFLTSENKDVADGVVASKVEKVSADLIASSTGTGPDGGEDVGVTGFGQVPVVSHPKDNRKDRRSGHGCSLIEN